MPREEAACFVVVEKKKREKSWTINEGLGVFLHGMHAFDGIA